MQKKCISFVMLLMILIGCAPKKKTFYRRKAFLQKTFYASPMTDGPAIVFVHGTKTSLISRLVHQSDYPVGFLASKDTQTESVMTRIGRTLNCSDPEEFPVDSFYYYTWPGKLSFESRLRAAQGLYDILRNHKGPITIITHSHGCNVALNLAYWAQKNQDTSFAIDRLILLAPPVQEVTKPYVYSPIFKRVYTFYSSADIMQVGDMQALYWESYAYTEPSTRVPWLSKRTFNPAPHIIQTRVLLDGQSPGHLNFLLKRFIKKLPALLKLVKAAEEDDGYARTRNQFVVNIPLFDLPPYLIEGSELKGRYTPRNTYHKTKRISKNLSLKSHKTSSV